MKNIILSCAFAFAVLAPSKAQRFDFQPTEHLLEWTAAHHQLTGAVKTVKWTKSGDAYRWDVFDFNQKGNLIQKQVVGTGSAQISAIRTMSTTTYTYNAKEQIQSIEEKGLHGNYQGKTIYNHKGESVEVTTYDKEDPNKQLYCSKMEIKNGYLTRHSSYRGEKCDRISSFTTYDVDKNGRLLNTGHYLCINGSNCDGSYQSKYIYNDKGQLLKIENDRLMKELMGEVQFTYDEKGHIKQKTTNGSTPYTQTFEYNDQNQIVKTTITYKAKNIGAQSEIYEYDKQGNWTRYVRIVDTQKYEQTRTIEYY